MRSSRLGLVFGASAMCGRLGRDVAGGGKPITECCAAPARRRAGDAEDIRWPLYRAADKQRPASWLYDFPKGFAGERPSPVIFGSAGVDFVPAAAVPGTARQPVRPTFL